MTENVPNYYIKSKSNVLIILEILGYSTFVPNIAIYDSFVLCSLVPEYKITRNVMVPANR